MGALWFVVFVVKVGWLLSIRGCIFTLFDRFRGYDARFVAGMETCVPTVIFTIEYDLPRFPLDQRTRGGLRVLYGEKPPI